MGKYAATRGIQGNKYWRSTANNIGNGLTGNIHGRDDYAMASFLYGADFTGLYRGYITARDSTNWMSDYLKNRGLDWSDIKYISMSPGFVAGSGLGRATVMFSKNIAHLYD